MQRTLAECLVAELVRRGRYAWQPRESLRRALGWTDEQMRGALRLLMDQHRIERAANRAKYRLNNARRVQAAP